jgi:tryptophanyl-tRNA synthetase
MTTETILSGIRATGRLHFGNFLGAVSNFVDYQNSDNTCLYFVADYHTLTTMVDPELLRINQIEIVKDYIAAGLDPERSILYVQSSVPEIAELSLLLGMLQPLGDLQRLPTFKDMVRKYPDNINLGTLMYPVLMAADILAPRATLVPVGEDQVPNLEMARKIARKFNETYGDTFPIPKSMEEMIRVPGLDGSKMGKSESDNAIDINSSIADIRQRYAKRGVTDVSRKKLSDAGDPYHGCKSVYPVHELVTVGEVESRAIAKLCLSAQIGCSDCKNLLVDSIEAILVPFQEKRAELADQDDFIRDVLHDGAIKARALILPTVQEVREKMGLVNYG